jgi:predicted ArsR family transcriptional regulator
MTTTRQRILAHLKKTRASTAREMARALNLSAPNVRHHLGVLASDGRVTVVRAHSEGRGRPEKVYSLSDALEGDNLSALADALLAVEGSRLQVEKLAGLILDVTQFTNLPIPKRLALLIEKLNEMHYGARWEAGAEGPRILFGRCPYARIIESHPELCQMDANLLAGCLGAGIRPLGKIEKGQGVCVFAVR